MRPDLLPSFRTFPGTPSTSNRQAMYATCWCFKRHLHMTKPASLPLVEPPRKVLCISIGTHPSFERLRHGQASLLVATTLQLLTEYQHDLRSSLDTGTCCANTLRNLRCASSTDPPFQQHARSPIKTHITHRWMTHAPNGTASRTDDLADHANPLGLTQHSHMPCNVPLSQLRQA